MGALGVWALAIGAADVIAPTDTEPDRTLRMWLATLSLPVGAYFGGAGIGLSLSGVGWLVAVTSLSGGCWLWLWRSGLAPLALAAITATFVGLVVAAGHWTAGDAPVSVLLERSPFVGAPADLVAVVVGLGLLLVATGNRVVRIALRQIEQRPGDAPDLLAQETQLRGGRVIGPLERLLIYGLGISGQLVAAGLVVAAKSLLRFSELRSQQDVQGREPHRVELMSEYLLIGSLLSWTLAFALLAVAVRAAAVAGS